VRGAAVQPDGGPGAGDSPDPCHGDEAALADLASHLQGLEADIDLAIHAAGILHEGAVSPEKSLAECRAPDLLRMFEVNSIGPLMTARAVLAAQSRKSPCRFAALSAMVGSISDNRLGGWYGYRASKAALNQFIKTLANECRLRFPRAAVVAMHPGTTDTDLSRPFQRNVKPGKLYPPALSAQRILSVLEGVGPAQSGRFFNWDGKEIPW
jgi:NAD(P)-dependent dehydrogenase (short-subunit alcohol dehydrogenase family)